MLDRWPNMLVAGHNREIAPPLVVRFGAMGDMVILTALLRTLYARFGCRVDLALTERASRTLLQCQPWVGTVYSLGTRKIPYWLNPRLSFFVHRLRARGPGPVWICQTDRLSHEIVGRAGYSNDWCVSQRDYPAGLGDHLIDRLVRMGRVTPRALNGSVPDAVPDMLPQLVVPDAWAEETRQWLNERGLQERPLVLIQAGNKRTTRLGARTRKRNTKYWPESKWGAVVDQIHERLPDAEILLLGVGLERTLNAAILRHVKTRSAINVAGHVPMRRLLALSARACAMVSVDTGPAHIAAAVGCPLVVLFGTMDPNVYAPRGENSCVEVVSGVTGAERPMLTITPDQVMAAWDRLPRSTR